MVLAFRLFEALKHFVSCGVQLSADRRPTL